MLKIHFVVFLGMISLVLSWNILMEIRIMSKLEKTQGIKVSELRINLKHTFLICSYLLLLVRLLFCFSRNSLYSSTIMGSHPGTLNFCVDAFVGEPPRRSRADTHWIRYPLLPIPIIHCCCKECFRWGERVSRRYNIE